MEEKGIDYLHVSGGITEVGERFVIPMYFPQGSLVRLAEGIKRAVKVPVIAVGAIHDPLLAEETLKDKRADLIAMGRALIADPELPGKIQSGRLEDIRACLRCNEGCSSRIRQGKTQRCAVNAEAGRERTLRIHPAAKPKRVCVIGGGPAGMETARILALRKHRVTLVEKENELGGLLRYASVPDFKDELRRFLQYLMTQVKKSGVEVLLGREATLDMVRSLKPDAVVLAAGSTMPIPEIPGGERPFVATALDLLSGKFQPGDRVLVAGGAAMGCEVAAHLAVRGKKVTVVEMLNGLALDLESRSRVALLHLLKERGVSTLLNRRLDRIEEGGALLSGGNGTQKEIAADSVILALGLKANQEMLGPLKKSFPEVQVIGDCLEPRKIYQAVHEGAFAGRAI
jgi:NADPH-dependent 2,4-dienoyl-CoA reductase/sulfur reductase-like enzyme